MSIQLDFFKTPEQCELDAIRIALNEYKLSSDKVRRGTYAKLSEVTKICMELQLRLEVIEKNICRG